VGDDTGVVGKSVSDGIGEAMAVGRLGICLSAIPKMRSKGTKTAAKMIIFLDAVFIISPGNSDEPTNANEGTHIFAPLLAMHLGWASDAADDRLERLLGPLSFSELNAS
jgi:hypothetical protein